MAEIKMKTVNGDGVSAAACEVFYWEPLDEIITS